VSEAGPIFLTGLDHSGKTLLRGWLNRVPGLHVARRADLLGRLRAARPGGEAAEWKALRELGVGILADSGSRRWGVQEAFAEWLWASLLRALPEARIVHLVRDPRGRTAAMVRAGTLGRGGPAAETAAWTSSAAVIRQALEQHPEAITVVRYESMVHEPQPTWATLCAFLQEPGAPPIEEGEQERLRAMTAATGTWAETLSAADIAFIERRAAAEMPAFGYLPSGAVGQQAILPLRLVDEARWLVGRAAWRSRGQRLGIRAVEAATR
jgi:hypothetical protein